MGPLGNSQTAQEAAEILAAQEATDGNLTQTENMKKQLSLVKSQLKVLEDDIDAGRLVWTSDMKREDPDDAERASNVLGGDCEDEHLYSRRHSIQFL